MKLGIDRSEYNKNEKFFSIIGSIFNSSRHVHDYDFLLRNPDYKKLICSIDTGPHNWLNFGISDTEKLDLFVRGAKAASEFLRNFKWQDYKKIREQLKAIYTSQPEGPKIAQPVKPTI